MIQKSIDAIALADLQALIDTRTTESVTLEFKLEFPDGSDKGVREFLFDVSSFANTRGGDILYGVAEDDDATASEIRGVAIPSRDALERAWDDRLRACIVPRLPRVEWRFVDVGQPDLYAVLIRVAPSTIAPHRVVHQGHGHFYGRAGKSRFQLDVPELRHAFLQSDLLGQRIRDFVASRVARIASGHGPAPLDSTSAFVIHAIPTSAFTTSLRINPKHAQETHPEIRAPGSGILSDFYNVDGMCFRGGSAAYAQVFDTGIIEGVSTLGNQENRPTYWPEDDVMFVRAAENFLGVLRGIGITPPLFILVSLTGARGLQLAPRFQGQVVPPSGIFDEVITLPEVAVESWPADESVTMKPILDKIWNGLGIDGSQSFNQNGDWVRKDWTKGMH